MTTMVIVFALITIAMWQRSLFLYAITSPLTIFYGLSLAIDNEVNTPLWVAGIVVAIIGMYCLFKAVMIGFNLVKSRGKE